METYDTLQEPIVWPDSLSAISVAVAAAATPLPLHNEYFSVDQENNENGNAAAVPPGLTNLTSVPPSCFEAACLQQLQQHHQQQAFRTEMNPFYDPPNPRLFQQDHFVYASSFTSPAAVPPFGYLAYPDLYMGHHNGLTFDHQIQSQHHYDPTSAMLYAATGGGGGGIFPTVTFDQFRQPYTPFDPMAFSQLQESIERLPLYKESYFSAPASQMYSPIPYGGLVNSPYCTLTPYTQFPRLPTQLEQSMDDPLFVSNAMGGDGDEVENCENENNGEETRPPSNSENMPILDGASTAVFSTAPEAIVTTASTSDGVATSLPPTSCDDKIRFRNTDYFSIPIKLNLGPKSNGDGENKDHLKNATNANVEGAAEEIVDRTIEAAEAKPNTSTKNSRKRPRTAKRRDGVKRNVSSRNPILTQFTVKFLKEFFENNDNRLSLNQGEGSGGGSGRVLNNTFAAYIARRSSSQKNEIKKSELVTVTKSARSAAKKSATKDAETYETIKAFDSENYTRRPSLNPVVLLDANLETSVVEFNNENLTLAEIKANDHLTLAEIKADVQRQITFNNTTPTNNAITATNKTTTAKTARKRKSCRNRCYEFESLQIGSFYVHQNVGRNKLRLYFGQKQLVYDFEYDYVLPGEDLPPVTLLVVVIVPLYTLCGLEFHSRKIIFRVSQTPRIVSGFNRQTLPELLKNTNFGSTTIDVTNGQLMSPYHLIALPRAQGSLVQKHLLSFNPAFVNCRINYAENSLLAAFVSDTVDDDNKNVTVV